MLGSGKEFVITKAQTYSPGHGGVIALICALSRYMELVHLQVSLTFLHHVGVPFIKIGSGDVINPIVMTSAAKIVDKPIVVSTGMTDIDDVRSVYRLVRLRS